MSSHKEEFANLCKALGSRLSDLLNNISDDKVVIDVRLELLTRCMSDFTSFWQRELQHDESYLSRFTAEAHAFDEDDWEDMLDSSVLLMTCDALEAFRACESGAHASGGGGKQGAPPDISRESSGFADDDDGDEGQAEGAGPASYLPPFHSATLDLVAVLVQTLRQGLVPVPLRHR